MKKLIYGACALLAVAAVGCSKGSCDKESCAAVNDSLSIAYGQYVGSMMFNEFGQVGTEENAKEDFMKGMQLVLGAKPGRNERMGMQVAFQLSNELEQLEEQGIRLDRNKVVDQFKKYFLADSLNQAQISNIQMNFRELIMKAQEEARAAKEAEKAQAPEAQANVKAGEEYVAKLKAENPEVKTTDSGLSYVIEAEGEGDKPGENATVVVNYTGKHLDGEVFDSSIERGEPATFSLRGVVKGFSEGLRLLGKGGKATLYIPGNLGYGVDGAPGAKIGPNEMLVFEVELVDIK